MLGGIELLLDRTSGQKDSCVRGPLMLMLSAKIVALYERVRRWFGCFDLRVQLSLLICGWNRKKPTPIFSAAADKSVSRF